jgi:hypothetical protein
MFAMPKSARITGRQRAANFDSRKLRYDRNAPPARYQYRASDQQS